MELQGTLTITGGDNSTTTIILGQAPGGSGGAVGTDTLAHLATTITNLGTTSGFTAAYNNGTGVLTVSQTVKTGPGNNTTTAVVNVSGAVSAVPTSANAQSATTADAPALGGSSSRGGIATISYLDGAGENLSSSDLTTQLHAQAALIALNLAITDAAAMDGYIGGQINTLNAVNSEISTQQENLVSAQNAIQATDYAAATSNMSKYEILSQTGIAALAQANSVEQEVTKLLQ